MGFLILDPIAFTLGPLSVRWYGILIALSVGLGLWLALREAYRLGFNGDIFIDMVFWVLPAAIIGARLYYVLFNWDQYSANPIDAVALWEGGLAIHGGLIGAFAAGYLFVRKYNLSFFLLADIAAPSIILGQAIGRWGNFMNQEAYGGPVSITFLEGLHLPGWLIEQMNILGTYYHPTFLYESLWNLAGLAILLSLRYLNPRRGVIFCSYLIWYSIGRFFIEGLRTDSLTFQGPAWVEGLLNTLWMPMRLLFEPGMMEGGNIRAAQLMSFLIVLAATTFLVLCQRKASEARYIDIPTEQKSVSGAEA